METSNPIDTVRLLLTLDCNLNCSYCCNKLEPVYSRFVRKSSDEIDFYRYRNVCLTGGEPFLYKDLLYETISKIPPHMGIYIYTNGLLITDDDVFDLLLVVNLKGLNIGLHTIEQLESINRKVEMLPVRFLARDIYIETLLKTYPERLSLQNLKGWRLNECARPNEDWVLLR